MFTLAKFSDHVYDWDSYLKAMLVTPPIHISKDLMSIPLLKKLMSCGKDTAADVLFDMKYGIGMWNPDREVFFRPFGRNEENFWMFAAYEGCMAGNASAVHRCMKECFDREAKRRRGTMSLEFMRIVWNAHNPGRLHSGALNSTKRLSFNDCVYKCMLHQDPVGIIAVINRYPIAFDVHDFYSKDEIGWLAERSGYEACKKVLHDYCFF